jgi:hypothetical protein
MTRPQQTPDGSHPMVATVRDYLDNAGITPDALRYAATHEALCRSWIFDLLTGLADTLESQRVAPPAHTCNASPEASNDCAGCRWLFARVIPSEDAR